MTISDVFNNTKSLFKTVATPLSKSFASGVDLARSLTKPISNVSSQDHNYNNTPSEIVTTYDKRVNDSASPLSKEPTTEQKSSFGVIIEKIISPFIINTKSQKSSQLKTGGDILTTGKKTSGNTLSADVTQIAQSILDVGYNVITRNIGTTLRDSDIQASKTTSYSPVTIKPPANQYDPSEKKESHSNNTQLEPNTTIINNGFNVLLILAGVFIVVYLFKKK